MAVINTYTDSVAAQGQLNTHATGEDFGAGVGEAMQKAGRATDNVINQYRDNVAQASKKQLDNEVESEVTEAHRLASKKNLEWEMALTDRANSATADDSKFATKTIEDVRLDMLAAGAGFKTLKAQKVFETLSDNLVTSVGLKAIHVQGRLNGEAVKQDLEGSVEDESKNVNANDQNYKASLARIDTMIDDPNTKYARVDRYTRNSLKEFAKQKLAASAVEGYFSRNIHQAAQLLLPDQVGEAFSQPGTGSKFDSVVGFIFKKEGGYKATDGNSGNPVNFGINQRANPDVDVKNLTKEGAKAIYLDRYWNKIGGDSMPVSMATVAMNAAVNMGVEPAKAMLAQSGGDPARFTDLVKQRYQSIVKNDPAQAQYLSGWLSRADSALAAALVPVDAQGQPIPQLKIPKDASLAPPQGVDIPGWNDLKLDTQQKFMAKLVTDFNSRVTVDRATLADDRKNMHANLLAGNSYSGEAALQARYVQAYGPEMATRMIKEDAVTKDLGQFSKSIRGRSASELSTALGAPPGDNSTSEEYSAYSRKVALVQADREELQKNPVDYVAKYSTSVNQAAILAQSARATAERLQTPDAIAAADAATQKLITASLAEQRRLGVASPAILSEAQEKQLTQRIEEIAGSGRDVAQSVDALYRSYGSYGPTVAAQMSKKIGGLMNVLGSSIDPSAATMLVEANRNKEELKKTLAPEKLKDLDVAVRGAMASYSASLAGIPNGMNVQANYQEQIGLLAMSRMSKLGESQNDAVQKAYQSLVGNLYKFQDGYRVPVAVDAKTVQYQANKTLNYLTENDVALLPGSLGNPKDRMAAQLSSIRAYGRWVTTSQTGADGKTEEGLTLMVPTPGGYSPVPSADGKPLFRSFGRMILDYHSTGVKTAQEALDRGDIRAYNQLRAKEQADARRLEAQRAEDIGRAFRAGK